MEVNLYYNDAIHDYRLNMTLIKSYRFECLSAIVCLGLGYLSGYASGSGDSAWFEQIVKPSFHPPYFLFPIVWTILYLIMGVVFAQLWRNRESTYVLLRLFYAQLIFNVSWSPLFFSFHRIDIAMIDLLLLWITLLWFMVLAIKRKLIFWLFAPYFLWESFAAVLNKRILDLN